MVLKLMSINSYYISIEFTDTIEMLKDPLTMEKIMKEVELIKKTRSIKEASKLSSKYSIPHKN